MNHQFIDYYDIDNDYSYVSDMFPIEEVKKETMIEQPAIIESMVDTNEIKKIDICKLKKELLTDDNIYYIHIFLIIILVIVCINLKMSLYTNDIKLHTLETLLMTLQFNKDIPKTAMS